MQPADFLTPAPGWLVIRADQCSQCLPGDWGRELGRVGERREEKLHMMQSVPP